MATNDLMDDIHELLQEFRQQVLGLNIGAEAKTKNEAEPAPKAKKLPEAKIDQSILAFLETGENAEHVTALADKIAREENADNLDHHSSNILNAIIQAKHADPDRVATAFGAAYICETHAGLVRTQQGKMRTRSLHLPSKPFEYTNEWQFDFEKNRWIMPRSAPVRTALMDRLDRRLAEIEHDGILRKLEYDCRENTGQGQFGYRVDENRKHVANETNRLKEALDPIAIKNAVTQIANTAKCVRELSVERQHERRLFLSIAEIHLNNLRELAQTFVRQMRAKAFDEWQVKLIDEVFETYVAILQSETYYFHGVSGAYGLSILTSGVDILRDLQIFLKGHLQEIRQSQMMERIAVSVEAIQREMSVAVSTLRGMDWQLKRANDLQKESNWLQHDQLKTLRAIGMVVSSMDMTSTTNTHSFGLFGASLSSTTTNAGPQISFANAYRHIEANSPRLLG